MNLPEELDYSPIKKPNIPYDCDNELMEKINLILKFPKGNIVYKVPTQKETEKFWRTTRKMRQAMASK